MSDNELDALIARTADGDAEGLRGLYDALGSAVYAVARAVTGDRHLAEDVLQDVFVQVYLKARTYRRKGRPRAWVIRIARNHAISTLRKRRREMPGYGASNTEDSRAAGSEAWPDAMDMSKALGDLTPTERDVVLLSVVGELSNREVAGVLGIPLGSVSWRYRAAMDKLRDRLSGSGGWKGVQHAWNG